MWTRALLISGATRGGGGSALGSHLASAEVNEAVFTGPARGLVADGIEARIAELTRLGSHARTATPIYHIHADPPAGRPFTKQERAAYWTRLEHELGLEGQPFASAIHIKEGREHEHRAYLRSRPDGTSIRLDHDYARREKVDRVTEYERGEPLTKGAHNRAVIAALEKERPEVAHAMQAAGLHKGARPVANLSPRDRLIQERTKVLKVDVARWTAAAWAESERGMPLAAALAAHGLRLAWGDKKDIPVVVDKSGTAHGLPQMLRMAARADGTKAPKPEAIAVRLDGMAVPSVADVRREIHAEVAEPAIPLFGKGHPGPLDDRAHAPGHSQPIPVFVKKPSTIMQVGAAPNFPVVPSRDSLPSGSGGGGCSLPEGDGGGGGGSLATEVIDGPGEPPGPGASIQEQQRYRERLFAYEEKKGKASARQAAALATENERLSKKGANSHVHVPAQAQAGTAATSALSILSTLGQTRPVRHGPAQSRHSRYRHAHLGRDEGGPGHGTGSRGHTPGNADAGRGRGRTPGRGEGVVTGDMYQSVEHRGQALRHRAALARATAALGAIDTTAMLDLLEPSRVAVRMLDAELSRITRSRLLWSRQGPLDRDPDASGRAARAALWRPLHEAKEALPAAIERARAASEVRRWWWPATWAAARDAADALARAHAAVAAATPTGDALDSAEHEARLRAGAARDAHTAWQAGTGKALDRREHLLAGIMAAVDGGDGEMRRAVLDEGIPAAMRLQDRREADREEPEMQAAHPHEHGDNATSQPGACGPK